MREKTVTGRKIAFWGTGNICRQILRYRPDIQPELFIDNYAGENESPLEEVPVYHPRQVSSWEGIFVVLVIDRFLSVKEQLTELGLKEEQDFIWYRDWLFVSNLPTLLQEADAFLKTVSQEADLYHGKKLIFSDFLAFDKDVCNFVKHLNEKSDNIAVLSEVGWIPENMATRQAGFRVKKLPMLLSHNQYIKQSYTNVFEYDYMKEYVREKQYLREATQSYRLTYPDMLEGYEDIICYYADMLLRKIAECWHPSAVILWNEFYAFHRLLNSACRELMIPVLYMEFGNIPGTITLEKVGQMGESWPAKYSSDFLHIPVSERDYRSAQKKIIELKNKKLNRNTQPVNTSMKTIKEKLLRDRPIVFYAGSNDYASGIQPYTDRAREYHSPIFQSSMEAAFYLSDLCQRNAWNFICKPHPMMSQYWEKISFPENVIYVDEVDIHDLIDLSDVVVTILSTVGYIALIRERPVVMLGYTQLKGKGCTYEAFRKNDIKSTILSAINNGFTCTMQKNTIKHIAQMKRYYQDEILRNC